ncbi:hypothetical protein [Amycolatopsis sp. PS_44_ISF1]|uniref:hypothetical protein n=1 Tax=Amycolatopsis sp. PS_44_ISF1 TaxID=2974917 RepID=UPI0028DD4CBC|nr:hypothetical protein [Amycolatopsis sp. PS_44_ISF1]MDT8912354.1 hypothetical protein [Amycolatopsis sp. PS_44_ISF1]
MAGESGPGAAVALAGGVVGVGALFLPWLTVAGHGRISVLAWCFHIVVGAMLVLALGARGAAAGPARTGPLAVARCAVPRYYLLGVTVGQAVVASVAGGFLAIAAGRAGAWPMFALAVLVVAGLVGTTGRRGPSWAGPGLSAAIVVVAALTITGGVEPGRDLVSGAGKAAFIMLFAFVGWEGAARLRGVHPGWLAAGAGLTGLVYVGLALSAGGNPAGETTAGTLPFVIAPLTSGGFGRSVAAVAGLLCAIACARNLALVNELARKEFTWLHRPLWTSGVAAVIAGAGVVLLHAGRLRLEDLLSVPDAMALAVFLTAAAGVLWEGHGAARCAAGAALLGYAMLIPFAGLALVWPVAVLLATALIPSRPTPFRRRNSDAPDQFRSL